MGTIGFEVVMKKKFLVMPFVSIGSSLIVISMLAFTIWSIFSIATSVNKPNLEGYIVLSILWSICLGFLIGLPEMIQYVVIDENGITARNPYRKIEYIKWEDVKEVSGGPNHVGAWNPSMLCFSDKVLIESEKQDIKAINKKSQFIRLQYSKKAYESIKYYYKGTIILP